MGFDRLKLTLARASGCTGMSAIGWRRMHQLVMLVVFGVTVVGLAACGRNGPPLAPPGPVAVQPPPAVVAPGAPAEGAAVPGPPDQSVAAAAPVAPIRPAATAAPQANAAKNGFDRFGNPVAPTGQKKPFFLDPLLQ